MITTPEWLEESGQIARMARTLPRWLSEVPLYRGLAPQAGCPEQVAEFLNCFRSLPIMSKDEIRRGFPHNFLPAYLPLENLLDHELVELERTSGTSEPPTPLLLAQGWWNEQEQAALQLNGWVARHLSPQTRRVTIASPVCTSEVCYTGAPAWSDRIVGQTLYVNLSRHPFLWTEAALARMAEETQQWQPEFLDVDPVYGGLFARYCESQRIRMPSVKFVLSSYEFLSAVHRRRLQAAFGVPVLNLYGSTETGHLLMENERGQMVPSVSTAFLEVVNPDATGVGDLVVTTLSNPYMPLIRYRIGDLVRAETRPYLTQFELHGRTQDALLSTRGQRVTAGQIDRCFEDSSGIDHYQLRQEQAGQFTLYYVPAAEETAGAALDPLRSRLSDLLATDRGLRMEPVDYIPCENSGKFRLSCRMKG